jgi:Pentapeptide repeats (8 copies)
VDRLRRIARWQPQRPAAMWVALLVVAGLAVLAGCVYVLPRVLVPDRSAASLAAVADAAKRLELEDARLKQRNDVRTTLLQGLAGAVVAVGLSLTWRQIRVNQEGQITERFNKAIDHLGNDKLDLRLGGIYALERIAKNSDDDRDTIAEVLTAFVRQRSPWPPSQPGQYRADFPIDRQPELRTRAADIQAAMTVLGRGGFTRQGALRLDLADVDVRKVALPGAHLEGANLWGAHLEGANLWGAHLDSAGLANAHLDSAVLLGAHLDDANLGGAHLAGASLNLAYLGRANLGGAHLAGADLKDAHLDGANLDFAHLDGASFVGATADMRTIWPVGFDAASNGISFREQVTLRHDTG